MKVIAAFSVLAVLAAGILAQNDFVACPQCAAEDVACRAECVGVPNPNSGQISNTQDCVARCNSKDPGLANTCMQSCVQQNFIPHNVPNVVQPSEAEKKNIMNPSEEEKVRQEESSTTDAATTSGTQSSTSATRSSSASKSSSHKSSSSSSDDDNEDGNDSSATSLNSGVMVSAFAVAVVAKMVL